MYSLIQNDYFCGKQFDSDNFYFTLTGPRHSNKLSTKAVDSFVDECERAMHIGLYSSWVRFDQAVCGVTIWYDCE